MNLALRAPRFIKVRATRRLISKVSSEMKNIELSTSEVMGRIIPDLNFEKHKGQAGRIGVIGGSKEYTGAPYFAAFTALRLGADLSHVFCTEAAATPIKSYSPDLIVHPVLDLKDAVEQLNYWLPRLHSIVIGPGLGRDEHVLKNVKEILHFIKEQKKPVIIDGDGLFLITREPKLVANYSNAVLTPNLIEFERLYEAVFSTKTNKDHRKEELVALSKKLGGVTLVGKGKIDIITNGEYVTSVSESGSPRRCGGQGDILAGAVCTFTHWAYSTEGLSVPASVLGSFVGCAFVKHLNKYTFDRFKVERPGDAGRSMVTRDMIDNIPTSLFLINK